MRDDAGAAGVPLRRVATALRFSDRPARGPEAQSPGGLPEA
jgi:hypothetical protein